jgi:hypothetical protein
MAVSIDPSSAKLNLTARPRVNTPVVSGADMSFTGTSIQAAGEIKLLGNPGDSAAGWRLGFIQAQWIETNWCSYRGQHNNDGSIFIQRARPPARPHQACRDCVDSSPVSNIFYSAIPAHREVASGAAGATFPLKLTVTHFDQPSETCVLVEQNTRTGKPNYLSEAQLEFHFCTVLSVQDPTGNFHHQLAFYWNMRWQCTFHPTSFAVPSPNFRITVVPAGTGSNVGHIIRGTPTDHRFTGVLTAPQTQSCNQVFRAARAAVGIGSTNRHESTVWQRFDVRRA